MFCKICSDISKATSKPSSYPNFYRFYQTHYDVLNLPKNCTAKDIKNAYIKLSKEHHPDINKNQESHTKFQKIGEAYKVLGKAESRREYDLGLPLSENHPQAARYYKHKPRNPYDDPHFWANRDRSRDQFYKDQPYYGVNGIPRLSNEAIVFFCLFFAMIGVGLQCVAINKSRTFQREALIRRSQETEKLLKKAKEAAATNGNPAQLEALKIKLLGNVTKGTEK